MDPDITYFGRILESKITASNTTNIHPKTVVKVAMQTFLEQRLDVRSRSYNFWNMIRISRNYSLDQDDKYNHISRECYF